MGMRRWNTLQHGVSMLTPTALYMKNAITVLPLEKLPALNLSLQAAVIKLRADSYTTPSSWVFLSIFLITSSKPF